MNKEDLEKIINSIDSPEHETTDNGITCNCWCLPKQTMVNGSFIFVHNDLIDREELKIRLGIILGPPPCDIK